MEGWRTGFRATVGGANAPASTTGVEDPTRALAPSPSLLRAAIAAEPSSASQVELVPARKPGSPLALFGMIGIAAAVSVGALYALGKPHPSPPTIVRAAPTIVPKMDAPPVVETRDMTPRMATKPDVTPSAGATPAVKPPTKPAAEKPPVTPPTSAPVTPPKSVVKETSKPSAVSGKPAAKVAAGALPHRTTTTSSRPIEQSGRSGTSLPRAMPASAPPMVPPPTSPPPLVGSGDPEQAAQTPQQLAQARRDEGASQTDAQNVRFVVQTHIAQVQACYSRAFKESAPGGRVDIGFLIGPSGRASKVRTEQNATKSTALSGCLEHLIGSWQFVRPADGQLELIYPFVFSPGT